jgi:hypothetical protein
MQNHVNSHCQQGPKPPMQQPKIINFPSQKTLIKGRVHKNLHERHLCAMNQQSVFPSSRKDPHQWLSVGYQKDDEKDALAEGHDKEKGIAFNEMC